jgi:RNA 2',3'-cyclic 3'-phosphodiesterase
VRLFVGVWPPPEVCEVLAALERPPVTGLRWTTPDQWHVTLRFLGEVPEPDVAGLEAALAAAARAAGPPEATLGPSVVRLGRGVLCLPVAGLDDVAGAVGAAVGAPAREGRGRSFRGHLTLARARGGRPVPRHLAGAPVEVRWRVGELCLVASALDPDGARYTTVAAATVPS